MRTRVITYIQEKYGAGPEYLWRRFPDYAVFRHEDNNKWFAFITDVPGDRFGRGAGERVDLLNVKTGDQFLAEMLLQQPGYFSGYHISRGSWISVVLDGTVPFEDICELLETSYLATASAKKRRQARPPKDWLVPANPKYFDIVHAFDSREIINWKQGRGIRTGDTVYMYVAAPVSAIMYKCVVTETDIPYRRRGGSVHITALMKIKLLRRYDPEQFTFDVLKDEYGVGAVRGPRGIPQALRRALDGD